MNGVNGWYSANQLTPAGIDSVGTNPLPRNGRRTRNIGVLLAVSTLLAASPSATDSQVIAKVIIARSPMAASHSSGPAVGRKPTSRATPRMVAILMNVWIPLPMTWPASTAVRLIAMVRNRAMMPEVMSIATNIAVPWAADATVSRRMPGRT
jgi:hypothetical protein